MSGLLWYGLFCALLCLSGIIFAVLHVHRLINTSRVHSHDRQGVSLDDDGIFTQLSPEEKYRLEREQDRLARSGIPNARLRADLPPKSAPVSDEELIEEEWISEISTGETEAAKADRKGTQKYV